jgi:hypothetical protein
MPVSAKTINILKKNLSLRPAAFLFQSFGYMLESIELSRFHFAREKHSNFKLYFEA